MCNLMWVSIMLSASTVSMTCSLVTRLFDSILITSRCTCFECFYSYLLFTFESQRFTSTCNTGHTLRPEIKFSWVAVWIGLIYQVFVSFTITAMPIASFDFISPVHFDPFLMPLNRLLSVLLFQLFTKIITN